MDRLKSGQMLGLESVLLGRGPMENAISRGFSSIYSLTRDEFIAILKENKTDYVQILLTEYYILFRKDFV